MLKIEEKETISIPNELIMLSLKFISKKERYKFRLVCKEWYQIVNFSIDSLTLTTNSFLKKEFLFKGIKPFRYLQKIIIERTKLVENGQIEEIISVLPNLKDVIIGHIDEITSLSIASNSIENIYFFNLTNLENVEIKCPKIEGIFFGKKSLYACRKIKKIVLNESTFLNTIDLCQTSLDDNDIIKILDSAKYIKNIYLLGCKKINLGISSYFIKNIDLSSTNINDDELSKILEKCPNLQGKFTKYNIEIKLEKCINLRNPKLSNSLNMEYLKIRMCDNLKNPTIELPNLKGLHIDLNPSLNQPWIKGRCLDFIDLSKTPIKDGILFDIMKNCLKVTKLNLKGCEFISQLKIKHDKLQILNLSLCNNLSKDSVLICPNLYEVIGTGVRSISENSEFRKQIHDNCHPYLRLIF